MYVYTYICAHGRLVSETRQRERHLALVNLVRHRAMCNHAIISNSPVEITIIQ